MLLFALVLLSVAGLPFHVGDDDADDYSYKDENYNDDDDVNDNYNSVTVEVFIEVGGCDNDDSYRDDEPIRFFMTHPVKTQLRN